MEWYLYFANNKLRLRIAKIVAQLASSTCFSSVLSTIGLAIVHLTCSKDTVDYQTQYE